MQAEEIGLLLKQERGQFLDFVSAHEYRRGVGQKKREEDLAREIVRLLSGMANADGGTVLVGVEPDNAVDAVRDGVPAIEVAKDETSAAVRVFPYDDFALHWDGRLRRSTRPTGRNAGGKFESGVGTAAQGILH